MTSRSPSLVFTIHETHPPSPHRLAAVPRTVYEKAPDELSKLSAGQAAGSVRYSTGIDDVEDLIEDLAAALERL